MATKKKRTQKPRPPSSTAAGRFTILLEQMQEQNRAVIEALNTVEQRISQKLDEVRWQFASQRQNF